MDRSHRRKKRSQQGMLIEADFEPPTGFTILSHLEWLMVGAILVLMVLFLVIYSITVHVESDIAAVSRETRDLDEANKGLQTKLNRLQSFEKITDLAVRMPQLQRPEEVIEVHQSAEALELPDAIPSRSQTFPKVYGY